MVHDISYLKSNRDAALNLLTIKPPSMSSDCQSPRSLSDSKCIESDTESWRYEPVSDSELWESEELEDTESEMSVHSSDLEFLDDTEEVDDNDLDYGVDVDEFKPQTCSSIASSSDFWASDESSSEKPEELENYTSSMSATSSSIQGLEYLTLAGSLKKKRRAR